MGRSGLTSLPRFAFKTPRALTWNLLGMRVSSNTPTINTAVFYNPEVSQCRAKNGEEPGVIWHAKRTTKTPVLQPTILWTGPGPGEDLELPRGSPEETKTMTMTRGIFLAPLESGVEPGPKPIVHIHRRAL